MRSRTGQAACVAGSALLVLAAVVVVTAVSDQIPDVGLLLRDGSTLAGSPWWVGSVSRLTNLLWAVSATLIVVAGLVAPRDLRTRLLLLGGLTAVLGLDDTLLLHEAVLPGRGVPDVVVMVVYGLAGLALGSLWLPLRRTAAGAAFFAGAAFLALSVLTDQAFRAVYVLEDGAKLMGVLAWGLCGAWALSDELARLRGAVGPEVSGAPATASARPRRTDAGSGRPSARRAAGQRPAVLRRRRSAADE